MRSAQSLFALDRVLFPLSIGGAALLYLAAVRFAGQGGPTLLIGAILALGTFAHVIMRPIAAVQIVLVAACYTRNISVLGYEAELLIWVLALLAIPLAGAWTWSALPRWARTGAALLLLGHLVAATQALDTSAALLGALKWALTLNVAAAFYATYERHGRSVLQRYATTIAVTGAFVALLGWLQFGGTNLPLVGAPYGDHPDATFGYYSNYANFLGLATIIAGGMALDWSRSGRQGRAVLMVGCAALTTWQVVFASSRGAILLVAVAAIVVVCTSIRYMGQFVGRLILLGLAGCVAYALIPAATTGALVERFQTVQGGDIVRRSLQDAGMTLLADNPMGLGWGNFQTLSLEGMIPGALQTLAHAHNSFIQVGLDAGWVGLAGFVVLAVGSAIRGVRTALAGGARHPQTFFTAALVGVLAQYLNDYFFFETGSLLFFTVLIAGAATSSDAVARDPYRPSATDTVQPRRGAGSRRAESPA